MCLSKIFYTLNHELLIININFYGLKQNATKFFSNYLKSCYQYCKKTGP